VIEDTLKQTALKMVRNGHVSSLGHRHVALSWREPTQGRTPTDHSPGSSTIPRSSQESRECPPGPSTRHCRRYLGRASGRIRTGGARNGVQGHASASETLDTYAHLCPIPRTGPATLSTRLWVPRSGRGLGRGRWDKSLHQRVNDGEPACRRGSVRPEGRGGHPSKRPTWGLPPVRGRTGRPCPTFGLAPGGVYRAARVTPGAGALLPHRFTIACAGRSPPSAVCSLLHCPSGRPDWPLASTLPCGAPTFLDTVSA
jgi:hypothetical protein